MKLPSLLILIVAVFMIFSGCSKSDDGGGGGAAPAAGPPAGDGGEEDGGKPIPTKAPGSDDASDDGGGDSTASADGSEDDGGDDGAALDEDDPLTGLLPADSGALASAPVPASLALVTFDGTATAAGRAFALAATTDFDKACEDKNRWDPATEPLKSLNRVLEVAAKTGYAAFVGKGKRISKMKLGSIFGGGQGDMAGGTGRDGGQGGGGDTLVDVTFEATRGGDDNKKIIVKIWFTRTIDNMDMMFWQYSGGNWEISEIDLNYYAVLTIHKNSRVAPSYGIFDFFYEMRTEIAGEEAAEPSLEGFVFVSDKDGEVQVEYREKNSSRHTYDACTTTECTAFAPATWEYSTTQLANAILTTEGGKKVLAGKARTASQYGSQLISGIDPWGYQRYVPKLTLKPGVALTVEGDPDGNGPIHDGQKIKFAPLFSEEFPQQRDEADCNADLHAAVDGMNDETMPLPAELPDDGNNVKAKIGNAPPGSFQVASIEGEIVIEKKEQE